MTTSATASPATTAATSTKLAKWNKRDSSWLLSLFGTAVGAGVLFLPINAGLGGIWPLIFVTILVGPMTYYAHRGLSRVVLSASNPNGTIIDAVVEFFGPKAGAIITIGYFLAIYPIVMIYGISITNTVSSLMVHQLHMAEPSRAILSFVLVFGLTSVLVAGEKLVLKVNSMIVYPLIVVLFGISVYLIPQWTSAQFDVTPTASSFITTVFITIPILVFAFNHSPIVSSFSSAYRKELGDDAEAYASRVLKRNAGILLIFVMFFVFSCVFTLSPSDLQAAKSANIPVLSVFAQSADNQLFAWLAQIIAIIAITSSFFGHFMGTAEGLKGFMVERIKAKNPEAPINHKKLDRIGIAFITLTVWAVAYANLSVIDMISNIVAPILALILFIMPVIATRKVPAMAKYKSAADIFTFIMGGLAIAGLVVTTFF
ncbi:serine transporter [Sinobacterium caligoides]|uniref:Serine transporter n=1 Tax=Sinobacterium caligoides TaxID=933926 RepID=A0A3N2DYU6_9GAMM|nr:aromatic amino acid transport family protein [Sinobacterium caligoides]ROS04974.1 serine transporter [Sinobacterium caligoides]